jgi:acetoin utilization protein AcuC
VPYTGEQIIFIYGPELASYKLSPDHPLRPERFALTMALLSALGWLDNPCVSLEPPRPASLTELLSVHSYPYVQAVQRAQAIARGTESPADLTLFGLGTPDNPLFADIHDAVALCAGATTQAIQAVMEGRAVHAFSPAGGHHHAHRALASGFCIYNDCAVAITLALDAGRRVAYLDFDAHHGDGVQALFYEDPRVLTASVHETGDYLFPGTGRTNETGRGAGEGTSVNIPLPPYSGNEAILDAFDRIMGPAVRAFAPDLLLVQTGADTHHADPLTDLNATMALYPQLARRVDDLAHECCAGRMCVVGGGGYDPLDVTPRVWTAFIGTLLGYDTTDVQLPAEWMAQSRAAGGNPPEHLLDDDPPSAPTAGFAEQQ